MLEGIGIAYETSRPQAQLAPIAKCREFQDRVGNVLASGPWTRIFAALRATSLDAVSIFSISRHAMQLSEFEILCVNDSEQFCCEA